MAAKKGKNTGSGPTPRALPLADFQLPGWALWLLAAVCLWVVLAFVYGQALTGGLVFTSADSGNAGAFAAVGDASLAEGTYPLWNPYLFAGMPSFGSAGYLKYVYPPSIVFNIAQGWGMPPLTWMFGHLIFGGLGMIWLLRRWDLPFAALLLGAVIFLLFPKVVAWGVHGHGSKLGAAMYMPWIVGSVWRVLDGRGWRYVGLTALFVGLQLLRGHPQISYYCLGLVVWLVVWNGFWSLGRSDQKMTLAGRWRHGGMVAVGLATGFLIAAILLIPMHDYSGISIRGQDTAGGGGVGLNYATGWSLAPAEYGSTVLPMAAGFGKATYLGHMPFNDYPNYFGFLLLVLAAAGCTLERRSLMAALLAVSLLAVLVSFGRHGFGFYSWIYGWLPYFNKFRIPSMILILPGFVVAVLAPLGAVRLARAGLENTGDRMGKILPLVLAGLGFLVLMGGVTGVAENFYRADLQGLATASQKPAPDILLDEAWSLHQRSLILIGLVLLTAGAAGWASTRTSLMRGGRLTWVLLLLVAVDLGAVDRLIVHPDRGLLTVVQDPQGRGRLAPAGRLMREHQNQADVPGPGAEVLKGMLGHDRVFPLGSMGSTNLWMADGIRSLGGYHPAKLAAYEQIRKRLYSQAPAMRLAAWLGGRVVSYDTPFNQAQLEALNGLGAELQEARTVGGNTAFYANGAALPRARLVTGWKHVETLPEKDALVPFLDGIQSGQIPFRDIIHLDRVPEPVPLAGDGPLPTPVFKTDGLGEVVLEVTSPVPALLLLADMMAPGWEVEVDGQEAPILTADLVLRAVALDAGNHTVRFHYSDPTVRRGLTLSLVGGILTLAMILTPSILPRLRRTGKGADIA